MWQKLKVFLSTAEQAGFAKAAKQLNLSKATVTRYIQDLEEEYHAKFFIRSTRQISLTEQGQAFYQHASEMLQLHEAALNDLNEKIDDIAGNLKIGMPVSILHHFAKDKLPRLLKEYPKLNIEIIQGNHVNDLLSSHFDMAIHCGPLPNVNFYYEKIADWQKIICASPAYLKKFGEPRHPDELEAHHCLEHADNRSLCWQLQIEGQSKMFPIKGYIKTNNSMLLKELAMKNMGITYLPSFTVTDAISDKTLQPILNDFWPEKLPAYVLHPTKKRYNKKIDIVIDLLRDMFDTQTNHEVL